MGRAINYLPTFKNLTNYFCSSNLPLSQYLVGSINFYEDALSTIHALNSALLSFNSATSNLEVPRLEPGHAVSAAPNLFNLAQSELNTTLNGSTFIQDESELC